MPNTETTGILEMLTLANIAAARANLAEAKLLVATQQRDALYVALQSWMRSKLGVEEGKVLAATMTAIELAKSEAK